MVFYCIQKAAFTQVYYLFIYSGNLNPRLGLKTSTTLNEITQLHATLIINEVDRFYRVIFLIGARSIAFCKRIWCRYRYHSRLLLTDFKRKEVLKLFVFFLYVNSCYIWIILCIENSWCVWSRGGPVFISNGLLLVS